MRLQDELAMGTVFPKNNDVRLKTQNSYSWLTLSQNEKLYSGDTLFTGENSKVVMELGDLGQIEIEPLSMVTLSDNNGVPEVLLHYGEFKSDLKQKEIVIKTKEETQVLKPASASIRVTQKKTRSSVKLLSGQAQVKVKNEVKELKVAQEVPLSVPAVEPAVKPTVEKIEVPPMPVVEVAPPPAPVAAAVVPEIQTIPETVKLDLNEAQSFLNGQYKISASKQPEITWTAPEGLKRFKAQIATDENFNEIILEQESDKSSLLLQAIPPQPVYFRVQSISENDERSEFSEPKRINVKTPVALEVPARPKVTTVNDQRKAELIFKPLPGAPQYEIQTAQDSTFSKTQSQKFTGAKVALPSQPNAKMYWRLRALDKTGQPLSDFSFPSDYKVQPIVKVEPPPVIEPPREVAALPPPEPVVPPPSLPSLKSPSVSETFVAFGGSPVAIIFQWAPAENASAYEIQVSETNSFINSKVEKRVSKPRHLYSSVLKAGTYFWRVRAIGEKESSSWTAARPFVVSGQ